MDLLLWLGILAVLLIIEAATVGLVTVWFAGGALAAAIASGAGAGAVTQWLLFLAVSLVLLFFTRPLAVRYMKRGIPRTNVNSLIGKKAVVIQKIDNLSQTGQVRINDIEWMARTESDGEKIPEESVVEIEAVRGVKLIVIKCKEELEYGRTYLFSCYYRDRSVGACILCSDRAAGICDGSRASWCLQGNLEYRNPF